MGVVVLMFSALALWLVGAGLVYAEVVNSWFDVWIIYLMILCMLAASYALYDTIREKR